MIGQLVCLVVDYCLSVLFFFFNDTATTEIYTLSLHDALPTSCLPLRCVLAFLPAEAWPAVAAFISCGADELAPRIDEALRRHGRQAGPAPLRNDLTRL